MLTQADIDEAVSESLAKTQELMGEYGEHFVRPLMDVQQAMMGGGRPPSPQELTGDEDGQRIQRTTGTADDDATAHTGL